MTIGNGTGAGPPSALTVVDTGVRDGRPVRSYVARTLRVERNEAGQPVFSLTLLLSRQPHADESVIYDLVQQGTLSLRVTLAPDVGLVAALPVDASLDYRPLFVRESRFTLTVDAPPGNTGIVPPHLGGTRPDAAATTLAEATASGVLPAATLAATLGRDDTLAVLRALERQSGPLRLGAAVEYYAGGGERLVSISGSWATVYDQVYAAEPSGRLGLARLRALLPELLATGALTVTTDGAGAGRELGEGDLDALFSLFLRLASVIVRRVEAQPDSGEPWYELRRRPHPSFAISYSQRVTLSGRRSLHMDSPLHEVLGGLLAGQNRSAFIHIVAPNGPGDGGIGPVRARVRAAAPEPRLDRGDLGGQGPVALAFDNGRLVSVAAALRPAGVDAPVGVAALAATALKPTAATAVATHTWAIDSAIIAGGVVRDRSLPVVDNPSAPVWADRVLGGRRLWYAPDYQLVMPGSGQIPDGSPFLFEFERLPGLNERGMPLLNGMVRFTLSRRPSTETVQAIEARGKPEALAVAPQNLTVSLSIPFVDSTDRLTKEQMLSAEVVDQGGTLTVTVRLKDEWVRLAYAALSLPGAQSLPARVHITYSFASYQLIQGGKWQYMVGPKKAIVPLLIEPTSPVTTKAALYLDARAKALRMSGTTVVYETEPASAVTALRSATGEVQHGGNGATTSAYAAERTSPAVATAQPVENRLKPIGGLDGDVVIRPKPIPTTRPPLVIDDRPVIDIIRQQEYALQTLARHEQRDLLLPCSGYDTLYRERTAQGTVAIGCQDALRLGETAYRQYDEIVSLSHAQYRVYRSLQQPGRYLVVPTLYRVVRYAATEVRAFRPALMVYVTVDPANLLNNRVALRAALMPDIAPYLRRRLRKLLRAYAALSFEAVIEYPTDIPLREPPSAIWTLGPGVTPVMATLPGTPQQPGSIDMQFSCDIPSFLNLSTLLQAPGGALTGTFSFRLADGSTLSSGGSIDLANITGPWASGPVETAIQGTQITFTNRTERRVAVSESDVYAGTSARRTVTVATELAPGGQHSMPAPAGTSEAYPVTSFAGSGAATLEETRSFIEDIHTNVLFVDQINHANHALAGLDVKAQIKNVPGTYNLAWREGGTGEIDMLLPLTTYLSSRIVQYQVRKRFTSGVTADTPWLEHDLAGGNVIGLTWEGLGGG